MNSKKFWIITGGVVGGIMGILYSISIAIYYNINADYYGGWASFILIFWDAPSVWLFAWLERNFSLFPYTNEGSAVLFLSFPVNFLIGAVLGGILGWIYGKITIRTQSSF